jgi:hypothetical protein
VNPVELGNSGPEVGVDTFVEAACPKMPPPPPGWAEWWETHRSEVRATILQAQESARRTIEHRYLITLEQFGMLGPEKYKAEQVTVPSAFLRALHEVIRVDMRRLGPAAEATDKSKAEASVGLVKFCGRACGKQGCDERCALPPDHDGYCSCRR